MASPTTGTNCPASSTRCPLQHLGAGVGADHRADRLGGRAAPGAAVGYTVTVTNSGQVAYSGATFTDPLAGVLDDAAYNGNAPPPPARCPSPART